jgi:sugar lactone lactonase YvrE
LVGSGIIYVADAGNNCIRKIVVSSREVTTFAGSVVPGYADGIGTQAAFRAPLGLATDSSGNIFVTDSGNYRIRQIVESTGLVTTLAGSGSSVHQDDIGLMASFRSPWGIAADMNGYVYVTDNTGQRIRQIVVSSGLVTTLAGSGNSGYLNGIGMSASFYHPKGIAVDGTGCIYLADDANHRIRQICIKSTSSCKSGSYCSSGQIRPCPPSTYNPFSGQSSISNCTPCPAGKYSTYSGQTGAWSCILFCIDR